jgi:Fibronectin type III domain
MGASSSRGPRFGWKLWCCGIAVLAVATIGAPAGAAKTKGTVPGAPTIKAVKAEVRGVRVAFKAPASNGGLKITSYRVECTSTDGGRTGSRRELKSPIKVLNLTAAKSYRCTVVAHNRAGSGAASAPSAPVVTLAR